MLTDEIQDPTSNSDRITVNKFDEDTIMLQKRNKGELDEFFLVKNGKKTLLTKSNKLSSGISDIKINNGKKIISTYGDGFFELNETNFNPIHALPQLPTDISCF